MWLAVVCLSVSKAKCFYIVPHVANGQSLGLAVIRCLLVFINLAVVFSGSSLARYWLLFIVAAAEIKTDGEILEDGEVNEDAAPKGLAVSYWWILWCYFTKICHKFSARWMASEFVKRTVSKQINWHPDSCCAINRNHLPSVIHNSVTCCVNYCNTVLKCVTCDQFLRVY